MERRRYLSVLNTQAETDRLHSCYQADTDVKRISKHCAFSVKSSLFSSPLLFEYGVSKCSFLGPLYYLILSALILLTYPLLLKTKPFAQ